MMRLLAVALFVLAGCTSAVTTSSGAPTSAATLDPATADGIPTRTATPTAMTHTSPTATPVPLPSFAQVAAAGRGVVWTLVGGSRLFLSSDRGTTWQERSIPLAPNLSIAFVDARTGWALQTGSPTTQCESQGALLWHTTDGATTWERWIEVRFDSTQDASGMSAGQCKGDLAFVDAERGFVSAWDPNTRPTIYRTSDGGKTWRASRIPDPPGFGSEPGGHNLRAGAVAAFGDTTLVGTVGPNAGLSARYVFRSSDGGATWSFASNVPDIGGTLVFLTPTTWLDVSIPSSMETTDGGRSWHRFTTDYSQAAPIAPQIAFGDSTTGYATVRGSIQRTTDGGAHWIAIKTPGTLSP